MSPATATSFASRLKVIASVEAETHVLDIHLLRRRRLKVIASVEAETTSAASTDTYFPPPQGHCFRGG